MFFWKILRKWIFLHQTFLSWFQKLTFTFSIFHVFTSQTRNLKAFFLHNQKGFQLEKIQVYLMELKAIEPFHAIQPDQ